MDLSKIAKCLVRSVSSNEQVSIESLYQSQTCVITFLRRFGCAFCRLGAKELSELKPQLDANGVRLVGIGLEELGLEEFQKGQFFAGDLYIDAKKDTYKLLGFKRFNFFSIFPAIFSKVSRAAYSKAKADQVGGDMKGDGMQTGGTMVIEKGGKTLLTFKQDGPADHVDPAEVLKALGIQGGPPAPSSEGAAAGGAQCDGDVCAMPKKE